MDQFGNSLKATEMNQANSDSEFDSDDDKSNESDNSSSETSKNVTKTDDIELRLNSKSTKYMQDRIYEEDDIESKDKDVEHHNEHQETKHLANSSGSDERLSSNTNIEEEVRDQQDFFSSTSNNSDHDKSSSQETETSQMSTSHALTISDIINTDNLDLNKSVELADIIDSSEFSQDKSDIIDSDIVDQSELIDSNELINDEESKDFPKASDDMDFDITEKLREMGEISVNPVKKGSESLQKRNDESEDEVSVEIARKPGDGIDDEDGQSSAERKVGNLRRNIREVMDDQQLDAATLSAQKQEMERLARVQEQQRIIREVQRQIALNRQNNKTQTRVISLLQGNTSVLKQASSVGQRVSIPGTGTVLVKIPGKGLVKPDKARFGKSGAHITPSVSIAPVKVPPKPTSQTDDTSGSETEAPAPKKAKKDVVTIVDSSSDDDCILLSDDGEQEEEPEEDTQNSGLHVNDAYNCPDEQGRVVINIGHPEGESDIFLAPQIARVIKPHQIGGVRFLFDNIIESSERFNYSTGFGCILAHSMGLGKTLQLVCFCDIFLRHTTSKTVLCIMPINTLQNWMAEFNMWLPLDAEASPLKIHGEVRPRNFNLHVLNDSHKTLAARAKVVQDWRKDGGVLLIGYELYRLLSLKKMCKKKKKRGKSAKQEEDENEDIEANKLLLDEMHEALVKPGPDLVVCDEGHRIKNSHASISLALKQIRSKRRIVLTGYPLQNNLQEYWCMVDFVRPNYLGTKTEFANMFERPIQNGQCIDSTPQDIRLMRYRAHVLHSLLLGFVQRRSHAVLQTSLPQKEEYVLLVRMTPFQRKLYDTFMNDVVRTKAVPNPLKAFAVCCKIWNHPDVLFHFLRKREAAAVDIDLDLDETTTEAGSVAGSVASSVAGSSRTSVSPATPKKGRGRNAPKGTKKEKKGKANTSQVQPFANNNTSVGSKPAATITPNSSNVVSENSNTSMEIDQPVVNPSILTSSPKHMEPADSTQLYTPQGIPESQPLQSDYSQPPVTDFNYHNSQPYQQPYAQSYYPPTNIKDDYRNNQYGMNPNQYGDGYAPYSQNMNYSGQQNYWNHNNYYPNMEYNNWNPDYGNNMYGNPNQYDNRYPGYVDNIKQEDKTWNTLDHDNQYNNPEKIQIKQEVDHTKFGDVKLEPLEDETILELKPIVPKEKPEPVVIGQPKPEEKDINIPEDMNKDKIIEEMDPQSIKLTKEEGIPYDWAVELLKGYAAGVIENSAKMEIFFCILEESIKLGDRILVFSQSLFTLNLIEDFLHKNSVPGTENKWAKNINYYRLDGSTSALEREKLINEFNSNPNIHIFLVSTRAGSLGINLVGANRVIVFDASWNPCHDTQAVCRVYRYGQKKPCFVYRLVMDNSLEKKIYDRQINKQGMADRVVDECNPDAHLSLKEVTNLCWDDEQDAAVSDFSHAKDKYIDVVMQKVVEAHSHTLSKEPFQHESLLIDRKEKKLSQAEKRLAQRGYELEKQAATRPTYSYSSGTGLQYRTVRTPDGAIVHRPVASVRPMQADNGERSGSSRPGGARPTRWIPAEVWQRQGMTAQEMTLPLDVVIPTSSVEKSNIVLKAGQKVMVLKSPKGIYMQLESGKIIAIRTAFKVGQGNKSGNTDAVAKDGPPGAIKKGIVRTSVSKISPTPNLPGNLKHNTSITVIPTKQNINQKSGLTQKGNAVPILNRKDNIKLSLQGKSGVSRNIGVDKQLGTARPYNLNRGKLQVKSITKSIGNIPNVAKPKEVPPPVDSEQETSNAGSSSSKDGDSSTSIKIDDSEMELGEKCNSSSENADTQASSVDITLPMLDSIREDDIAIETNQSSTSEESTSANNKSEETSHTRILDTDSSSTVEGSLNETSNMDVYPMENTNAISSDDPAVNRPTSVVDVNEDSQQTQSTPKMSVDPVLLPREKVMYRPNLVDRRAPKPTTTLQRTSLKNYRHKSSHKQILVPNNNANSPMGSCVNLGESSLSQLEKSTTALSNESNNRFQSSLSNITSSYTPTIESLKRDSMKDPPGNSKKMKYSDPESTLENKTCASSGALTAKRSTGNLDEKPIERYATDNNTSQSEDSKNIINLDDKTDSSTLNNFSTNEFSIGNNYPKHTSHTLLNPQRIQETDSLQQFSDCTNIQSPESNVITPSNKPQHPLHIQQTSTLAQSPQLNLQPHPQHSQSPHPQLSNPTTLHTQIQSQLGQPPQVQPPQVQPPQVQPPQVQPPQVQSPQVQPSQGQPPLVQSPQVQPSPTQATQVQPPHGQMQPPHLQLSHPQPPHPHPPQPPHPQPPHSQHYPPYPGGYSYPTNWGAPPSDTTMYPNYDPSYSPLFHGHSAFHRPEPLPVPVPPGSDVNQPGSYPIHPYPPHPTTPATQSAPYTGNQNSSGPNMTAGAPQAPNIHQSYGPPQNFPPQNYPGQNPVPNYSLPGQNLNPYPGFAGQPIPPYGQFSGNFTPAPMNQPPYNTRPMYPTPDYTGSGGYGTPGTYSPYPPQTTNQWGQ